MHNCNAHILCSILKILSGPVLLQANTCHAMIALARVQAHTYEGEDPEAPIPTAHSMLKALAGISDDMEEYVVLCGLVRHMLHPQTGCRAKIKDALESKLFADC